MPFRIKPISLGAVISMALCQVCLAQGEPKDFRGYGEFSVKASPKMSWNLAEHANCFSRIKIENPEPPSVIDLLLTQNSIEVLELYGEKVTDRHLKNVANCVTLTELALWRTSVDGSFMSRLTPMKSVETLNLGASTMCDASVKHLKAFPNLKTLELIGTPLTESGVQDLPKFDFLEKLTIPLPEATSASFDKLREFSTLRKLHLVLPEKCDESRVADFVADMPFLEEFRGTYFSSDKSIKILSRARCLTHITLTGNDLTPEGLKQLERMPKLDSICFWKADITDDHLKAISALRNLRSLELMYCERLTDRGMQHICQMTQLETFSICSANISDKGLRDLRQLKFLRSLAICDANIGDGCLDAIASIPSIEELNLVSTKVTLKGLMKLTSLRRLRSLQADAIHDASQAELSGLLKSFEHLEEPGGI